MIPHESEVCKMISNLATYTNITKNRTSPRNHAIDRITIHCFVGQVTARRGADYFAATDKQASANYVIGKDGDIACSVDEADRSWCSSSASNDHRAVTIECASDTTEPYAIADACYAALVNLCADICRRHGKTKLLWVADKDTALAYSPTADEMLLTVHRWFAAKACPGDYIYARLPNIATTVTARLTTPATPTPSAWAAQAWSKACAAGVFDGSAPQGALTREMLAVVLDRLGLMK